MDKRFWGVFAVIAVVLGSIFFIMSSKDAGRSNSQSGKVTTHVKGEGASGITLTEYGDFQCPACGQFYPIVKQLYEKYQKDIKFQFRNYPLVQIHDNAFAASRAAEAADLQGKFWEMHDKLYENQQVWAQSRSPQNEFETYAKDIGINMEKYKTDFRSKTVNDRVQADVFEGNRLKIKSTPTFFIDGKKISNPQSLEEFTKVIDNAIEQKTGKKPGEATAPAGTSEAAPEGTTEAAPAGEPTPTADPAQ